MWPAPPDPFLREVSPTSSAPFLPAVETLRLSRPPLLNESNTSEVTLEQCTAFRQAMPRPVLHLISSTPLFPGLGSCPHFQLYSPEYLCKAFFFLACPGHKALFPVHLLLWLFSITSDVSCLSSPRSPPSPALPCPWDVKAVLWIHHKPTSTPALLRWIRHLPISTVFLLHLPGVPLKHLQNLCSPLSPLRRALHHHGALKTKQNMTAA